MQIKTFKIQFPLSHMYFTKPTQNIEFLRFFTRIQYANFYLLKNCTHTSSFIVMYPRQSYNRPSYSALRLKGWLNNTNQFSYSQFILSYFVSFVNEKP